MFGMGMGELIVILIVALLVLGPDKIPDAAKAIGKGMRELRKHSRGLQETLEQDEQLSSTVREIKSALRGDDPVPSIKPPASAPVGRPPAGAPAVAVKPAAGETPALPVASVEPADPKPDSNG